MKALILNGLVVDVAEESFPVHPSMIWVDCPADTVAGFTRYDAEKNKFTNGEGE